MASQIRDLTLPVPPHQAYGLIRASGAEIPKFRCTYDDPATLTLAWKKGWGLTNPVEVKVNIYQGPDGASSLIRYEASILALVDPFGFLTVTLDQFAGHLQAHYYGMMTNTQPPPPLKNSREVTVSVILVVISLVVTILVLAVALPLIFVIARF